MRTPVPACPACGGALLERHADGEGREHCGCRLPRPGPDRRRSRAIPPPAREHPPVAWALLDDYNRWRSRTSALKKQREQHRVADFKPSDERLALLSELAAWCDARRIHPRVWLYLLFRKRGWFHAPRLIPGDLMKQKHVVDYRKASGLDGYRRHVLEATRLPAFDPNVDMAPANEIRKLRLVDEGRAAECMEASLETTYGFHPGSAACAGTPGRPPCPAAPECARRLEAWCDFDIIGLRAGRITRAQAQAAVREAEALRRARGTA